MLRRERRPCYQKLVNQSDDDAGNETCAKETELTWASTGAECQNQVHRLPKLARVRKLARRCDKCPCPKTQHYKLVRDRWRGPNAAAQSRKCACWSTLGVDGLDARMLRVCARYRFPAVALRDGMRTLENLGLIICNHEVAYRCKCECKVIVGNIVVQLE